MRAMSPPKIARRMAGYTQEHAAEQTHMSVRTIQRIERYGRMQPDQANAMSEAYSLRILSPERFSNATMQVRHFYKEAAEYIDALLDIAMDDRVDVHELELAIAAKTTLTELAFAVNNILWYLDLEIKKAPRTAATIAQGTAKKTQVL